MSAWNVFRNGISRALKYWQSLALAYFGVLLVILLLSVIPALALLGPGHSTAMPEAANGIDAWIIIDILSLTAQTSAPASGSTTAQASAQVARDWSTILVTVLSTVGLITLASWLAGNYLFGGLLLTYAEAPQPFSLRRFLWGCWHWWASFLVLGILEAILVLFVLTPIGAVTGYLTTLGRFGWLVFLLFLMLIALFLALLELARAWMVVNNRRNLFAGLWQAIKSVFHHPLALAGLYSLALLLLLLLHLVFRLGLLPRLPLAWWPLVLLVQQTFIFLRLWARCIRLAGCVALTSTETTPV